MSMTHIFGLPIIVIFTGIMIVYFGCAMVDTSGQNMATEISQSIESNVNEIVREEMVLALDKEALQTGYMFISDVDSVARRIQSRITDYLYATYGTNVLIPGFVKNNARERGDYNNYFSSNLSNVTNYITVTGGKDNRRIATGSNVSGIGVSYTAGGQYGSSLDVKNFPSCTISNYNLVTIRASNTNLSGRFEQTMNNINNTDDAIVGVYLSLANGREDADWDKAWQDSKKAFPIVIHCSVDLSSYVDVISGTAKDSATYDNRSVVANKSYAISSDKYMSTSSDVANDAYGNVMDATSVSDSTSAVNTNTSSSLYESKSNSAALVFNEKYSNSTAAGSSTVNEGAHFNVGLDVDIGSSSTDVSGTSVADVNSSGATGSGYGGKRLNSIQSSGW